MNKEVPLMGMVFDKENLAEMGDTLDDSCYELADYLKPKTARNFRLVVNQVRKELRDLPEDFRPAWFKENKYTIPRKEQN
jgi:hypothetical protein